LIRTFLFFRARRSEAIRWSQYLWTVTTVFVVYIAVSEMLERILAAQSVEEETEAWIRILPWVSLAMSSLDRFAYGGLGACVYLLRTLHILTYRREFNRDRVPEYFNRILLGLVSGGAASLFMSQFKAEDGTVTLSEAALAFLAGYNTDFLFRAIERVAEAILPKVGLETMRRAPPVPVTASVSLNDLLDRLGAAQTEPERELLRELIAKVKDRL
jgi:hypothetical protein